GVLGRAAARPIRSMAMKRSYSRVLVSHAGSLPRPEDLREMLIARQAGPSYQPGALQQKVHTAVAEVVRAQAAPGIDIVNDGEFSKINFTSYARERLSGISERRNDSGQPAFKIWGRDEAEFPEYFAKVNFGIGGAVCNGPLRYTGHEAVRTDIEN